MDVPRCSPMMAMDPPLLRSVAASRRPMMMTRLLPLGGSARRYRGLPTTPGMGLRARRAPNREKEAHHSSEAGNNRAWLHPHSIDQGAPKLKRGELTVGIVPGPRPFLAWAVGGDASRMSGEAAARCPSVEECPSTKSL